jgi:FixJ family two-component response regulator
VKSKTKQHIFFVDDEAGIRKVADNALKKTGCMVSCFGSAAECLEQLPKQDCNLLVTDVKMPGMDGLTLLTKVKYLAPWVPVLVITGYGDIPMAVRAMKLGAVDFIEKPLDRNVFLQKVESVLRQNGFIDSSAGQALTKAEKKVLKLILEGKTNKQIAHIMSRSIRTVEFHRANIMHKFNVDNLVELIKKAACLELGD